MGACCSCYHDKPLECDKPVVHIPERSTSSSISSIYENQQSVETPGPEIQVDLEIPAIPYQVEHVRRMSSDDEEIICDVTRNEVIEYTVVDENMAVNTRSSLDVASIQTVTHDDSRMADHWGSISITDDPATKCENRSDHSTSLKNGSGYNIDCSISCSSNSTVGYY